jgi:SAM-dependent methyltransferase
MKFENVGDFYDRQGWCYEGHNTHDAVINENLTRTGESYVRKVRLRIFQSLGEGSYLLDIGCGPIQYPEYVKYSSNYEYRVCVDLSEKALKEAERKIGQRGIFYKGDYLEISNLAESPFDGAALINVLYHVDKDSQRLMVEKIIRDLKVGGRLVVVYSNPRSFSSIFTRNLLGTKNYLSKMMLRGNYQIQANPIYFFRHPISFWKGFEHLAKVDLKAWRTFDPSIEKLIFKKYLGGKVLLNLLYKLENLQFWAYISEYQIVILEKK